MTTLSPNRRTVLWFTFQLVLRVFFSSWIRLRVRGRENLPRVGGALLLMNHQSFLDPLLVGAILTRPVIYLARHNLFGGPIAGRLFKYMYVIPINQDAAAASSLRLAIERMTQGFLVGIFPEGRRTEDGQMGPFMPGFVALLKRVSVPVFPVGIAGAYNAMPRSSWWIRPVAARVVIGEPISPDALKSTDRGRELVEDARQRVLEAFQQAERWRTGGA